MNDLLFKWKYNFRENLPSNNSQKDIIFNDFSSFLLMADFSVRKLYVRFVQ